MRILPSSSLYCSPKKTDKSRDKVLGQRTVILLGKLEDLKVVDSCPKDPSCPTLNASLFYRTKGVNEEIKWKKKSNKWLQIFPGSGEILRACVNFFFPVPILWMVGPVKMFPVSLSSGIGGSVPRDWSWSIL